MKSNIPTPAKLQAIERWLGYVLGCVNNIRENESTISRRQLLQILYSIGDSAINAIAEFTPPPAGKSEGEQNANQDPA